jgi:formylglycine-generating enzyme required for sulfatase activity
MKGRALPDGTLSSRLQGPYQERAMASTGPCPEVEEYQRLLSGQLSAEEVEQLAQHVEACSHCAEVVAALQHQGTLHEVARAARAAADLPGNGSLDALIERVCRQLRPASGTDTPQTIEAPSELSLEAGAFPRGARISDEGPAEVGAEARAASKARHRPRIALPCSFSLGLTAAVLLAAVGFVGYLVVPAILQKVPGNRSSIPLSSDRDGPSVLAVDVSSHHDPAPPPPSNAATSQNEPAPPASHPVPPQPSPPSPEELAGKAREILRANCYRCHGQDGAIEGGFNYVLDPQQLVARRKVMPGSPERSKLYNRITDQSDPMPPAGEMIRPSQDQVALLKAWIETGAPEVQSASAKREFLSQTEVLNFIRADLETRNSRVRPFVRYFTITNLYDAGLSEDELKTYRHGLAQLVNSLSLEREITVPEAIDQHETILRIDLRKYKWGAREWDMIVAAYPYGMTQDTAAARYCYEETRCRVPYVRADWFVFAASRPPLYHDLLQLPRTDRQLEEKLGVDVAEDIRQGRVARAGFDKSGVALNNRLIERHSSDFGAYWKTYDFAGNVGRQSLFEHPLGPGQETSTFRHAGGEIIFNLPNGLQGYFLVDAEGNRLDKGPVGLVIDKHAVKRGGAADVINGISCMACHGRGVIDKSDQVRDTVQQNVNPFSTSEVDTILALYPPKKEFDGLLRKDRASFRRAVNESLGKAEERRNEELPQTDPVVALAARYEEDLDLKVAAAEAGVQPADFREALDRSAPLLRALGRLRDNGGTVKRQVLEEALPDLVRELRLGRLYRQQIVNSIGMQLTAIPAGRFTMGSPANEAGRSPDEVQHNVEITQEFYMGVHEVTQEQYQQVMKTNPSYFQPGGRGEELVHGRNTSPFPVEGVSWEDAKSFCDTLSKLPEEKRAGRVYSLPTEAQWEYACRGRANALAPFNVGQTLSSAQANFDGNHPFGARAAKGPNLERTTAVGSYAPNDFGLYDMHGNVAEWCADWYDANYYNLSPLKDPQGPDSGTLRVLRGGSWLDDGKDCRAPARRASTPETARLTANRYGFRVVCVVAEKNP